MSVRRTAVSASSAASASASAARRTSSSSSLCRPSSCFASSPTPQSSSRQDSASPRIQRHRFPSPAAVQIHKSAWLSRYPAASASAYSTRVYSTAEEDLDDALDCNLSGSLREEEGKGEEINPMTAELGGRGYRRQQQVEGGLQEGSSLEDEEEEKGIEVPSKTDFRDPKFTSTSNPYWTKNGCTQKFINLLSSKGITNLTPVQDEDFVPVLEGRHVIGRSRTGTGKTLAFGIPAMTRIHSLAEEKGNSEA